MYNNFFGLHHIEKPQESYWELSLVTEDYSKSYTIHDNKIIHNMKKIITKYPTLFTQKSWGNNSIKGLSYYINKDNICDNSEKELNTIIVKIKKLFDNKNTNSTA